MSSVTVRSFLFMYLLLTVCGFSQNREVTVIEKNWKFTRENKLKAYESSFNDSYWKKVKIPHTWNNFDGQDGGTDYYRGVAWYRNNLKVDSDYAGKRVYLKFEGVSSVAEVFLNGQSVGTHKGSFGAFCFDVTQFVNPGKDNILAVRVSNAKDSTLVPLKGDFTLFGGIYRSVSIFALNDISISPLDFASSGVYVKQSEVSEAKANLEVTSKLLNSGNANSSVNVKVTLRNADGSIAAEKTSEVLLKENSAGDCVQSISIEKPHLWNGKADPYMYSVEVSVLKSGKVLDKVTETVGLRYYSISSSEGLSLNGKPYRVHGVNRHQDRENKGWAITSADQQEDYKLIEEIGATGIRLAHYQHAQEFYSLCDKGGLIVWAEIPVIDEVSEGEAFLDNCKLMLTEEIKQNYNHPSIFFWSVMNELIPDKDTALFSGIVKELNTHAKSLDATRMTANATRSKYDCDEGINSYTDVLGYNLYRGWYEKQPEDFGESIDKIHNAFPYRKIAVTEYGAGAGINQHEFPAKKPAPRGPWHPEEWQSYLHEVVYDAIESRPFVWGSFVWNMFDFAVDNRSEGEQLGINDKGLVSYDRKVKKDAFYFYKSKWTTEPMIYLTSKRFNPWTSANFAVKVYSNCDRVEVSINGDKLTPKNNTNNVFLWDGLKIPSGKNVVMAKGFKGDKVVFDESSWMFQPKAELTGKK